MADPVTFLASIAPIETAIAYTGDGDGQRIKFDVPESELGNAAGLLALRRRLLRITVTDMGPIEDYRPGDNTAPAQPPAAAAVAARARF